MATPRYYHHGGSPAAWTGSLGSAVGFIVVTVGVFLGPNWVVIGVGAAIVLLAVIATLIMKAAGFGQP